MKELWDNVEGAIENIKEFVLGFIDICSLIFGFIPEPFSTILAVVLIIIVAVVVIKVVRG